MIDHEKHDRDTEESIMRIVDEYGWYVAQFEATAYLPSFAYTIGLWKNFKHPELIGFGLPLDTLHSILNIGGHVAKDGNKIVVNQRSDEFFEKSEAFILEVNHKNLRDYFGYGIWYNQGDFPAYQIVWTDKNHRFPWEEKFDQGLLYRQPLLDRNFEFKFREEKNLNVITNRHFVEERNAILYVEHDEEGDWIFLTGDKWLSKDATLVRLEDMINRDHSLNDLFNLDYGEFAQRENSQSSWKRGKHTNK